VYFEGWDDVGEGVRDQAGGERSARLPPRPPVADNEFLSTLGLTLGSGLGLAGSVGEVGRGGRASSLLPFVCPTVAFFLVCLLFARRSTTE
jgi:hypothetical protein